MATSNYTVGGLWLTMNAVVRDNSAGIRERVSDVIGMPFSRYRALRRLDAVSCTQRELADKMSIDASAMTGIVTDLAARGLVERTVDPADARRKIVSITEAGRQVVEDVRTAPGIAPASFDVLTSAQREQLAELLNLLQKEANRDNRG